MERIFLGWDAPLLHLAADYLIEQHTTKQGRIDMKSVSLVLPGRRACNRLEEILAERAAARKGSEWYPPEFMTLNALPERFYKHRKPIAGAMTQCFAWLEAVDTLRKEDEFLLREFLPKIPDRFDARLDLGWMLAGLHYELAAEDVDFKTVAEECRKRDVTGEIPRWNALARLQEIYAGPETGVLDAMKLWDLQMARRFALDHQTKEEEVEIRRRLRRDHRRFYLLGLVDMNKLQKHILEKYGEFITTVVFAPGDAGTKKCFDKFGCLEPDRWFNRCFEIADEKINVVWKPEDQADAVLKKIHLLQQNYRSSEIAVGVPDKQVIPFVQHRIAQAGLTSHLVEGETIEKTPPYRMLESLLRFLKTTRFRDYATWLRHPDVEGFLSTALKDKFEHLNLVVRLDEYYNRFYPIGVVDDWKSYVDPNYESRSRDFNELRESRTILKGLLGPALDDETKRPISEGLSTADKLLKQIYSGRISEQSRNYVNRILETSRSLRGIPVAQDGMLRFSEVLEILLIESGSERLLTDKDPENIELLGWLEMPMDDAPVAIVTGMNDGVIPSFSTSDMFLPDRLRKELGLMDNRRRGARDAYSLTVLMETRKHRGDFQLIAGRRSSEGGVLLPSRFFFASKDGDKAKVVRRVRAYFGNKPSPKMFKFVNPWMSELKNEHLFRSPALPDPERKIESISVTDVGNYKKCPYRFFLSRKLYLESVDDLREEMPPNDFGTFIHDILQQFGESELRDTTSSDTIRDYLRDSFDRYLKENFHGSPRAAIAMQIQNAAAILDVFAEKQAQWRKSGYRIDKVEYNPSKQVMLSGLALRGKIDRIDKHEETGEIVVLDYKSGKSDTEKIHRKDKTEWVSFQLPLYKHILVESGYAGEDDQFKLSCVPLQNDLKSIDEKMPDWSGREVAEAIEEAKRIAEEIRTLDWSTLQPKQEDIPFYWNIFDFICHCQTERW